MGKNDFNIDFDFEEEFGFDPKAFLGTEDYDDNVDLSEFSDEELGLTPQAAKEAPEDTAAPEADLDLDGLDLGGDFDLDEDLDLDDFLNMGSEEEETEEEAEEDYGSASQDFSEEKLTEELDLSEEEEDASTFTDEAEWEPESLFSRDAEPEEIAMNDTMEYTGEPEQLNQTGFEDAPVYEEDPEMEEPSAEPRAPRQRPRKEVKLPKVSAPNIFTKFYDLYFAPVLDKSKREEPVDPNNPRRRRRKSKAQIFKEVYLPPIIACVCLILVLSFVMGSLSNAIERKRQEDAAEQSRLDSSESAEALAQQQYEQVLAQAEKLAVGYNYDDAITLLESLGDASANTELAAKRAEYVTARDQLVEIQDPTLIPNLSFHVLIEDLPRAMADDDDLAGSYNKNFVSTGEFKAILNQLYANGYVLVDFDSFTNTSTDVNGNQVIFEDPIRLPADKKPVMITETMVNYFGYMIDSDEDGVADAGGDGFASKLVVQNGEIKAEYVDSNGQTLIGDYDLVPILESFIEEHPDFSYRGARATLAVTGYEGIFGYRTNTSYVASVSQDYYNEQVAGAKEVVSALREKGYTLACFTYDNVAYGTYSVAQITADLQNWTQQITPVIGDIDTFVFARTSSIQDYTGAAFNVMSQTGFRYFVSNGTTPYTEVNSTYVRQNRLMVTGQNMQWYPNQFTGMFDCASILDVNTRGSVPN